MAPAQFPARSSSIPAVLARIGNLELVARTVVDGFINGLHRSPFFGASVDFAEHRGYVPGDDIRRVDWRCTRAPTGTTSRSSRPTRTPTSSCCSTSRSRWRSASGITQARLRQDAGGVPDLSRAQAARPRRPGHLRRRRRRSRAAVGQAPRRRAAHARSRQGRAARPARSRRCASWPSTSAAAASSS